MQKIMFGLIFLVIGMVRVAGAEDEQVPLRKLPQEGEYQASVDALPKGVKCPAFQIETGHLSPEYLEIHKLPNAYSLVIPEQGLRSANWDDFRQDGWKDEMTFENESCLIRIKYFIEPK